MIAYVTMAAAAPSNDPAITWAGVWSLTTIRDQAVSATRRYPGVSQGPKSRARIVTEPAATAQWMEIFHTVVSAASTATLPSIQATYPDSSLGAPRPASRAR